MKLIWRGKPVYCGGGRLPLVALTFDDGPSPWTLRLVAALRAGRAPATFFLVGSRVRYWPDGARAAATAGALGNHTWSHPHLRKLRPGVVRRELQRTQTEIVSVTRAVPAVFRPPYEEATPRDDRIGRGLNLLDVRWSVDSGDSRRGSSALATARAVGAAVRPGSIVLLHDSHAWTAEAVRLILGRLHARRLHPVTVPTLLERDPPGPGCT